MHGGGQIGTGGACHAADKVEVVAHISEWCHDLYPDLVRGQSYRRESGWSLIRIKSVSAQGLADGFDPVGIRRVGAKETVAGVWCAFEIAGTVDGVEPGGAGNTGPNGIGL